MLVSLGIKASGVHLVGSPYPFLSLMSFQHSLSPFSFKNDTNAPEIVEAMEQVRVPASLCLK